MLSELADLVLSRACVTCNRPGPVLCANCWDAAVAIHEHRVRVDALPSIQVTTHYSGIAQQAMIAMKERGVLAMAAPIGAWIALAVARHGVRPCALVPIPPHRSSIATRGADPLALSLRHAGGVLRQQGIDARIDPILHRVVDQGRSVGRSAVARVQSAVGTLDARMPRDPARRIVVVDDVVTTGATMHEAVRAITVRGLPVAGLAAAAGTPARGLWQPGQPGLNAANDGIDA